jgi:hypothetical protein
MKSSHTFARIHPAGRASESDPGIIIRVPGSFYHNRNLIAFLRNLK